jgi:predicted nucleotidyltransferase
LGLFLEEKLGHKVDVVPKRALREEIKGAVLKEVVNL